MSNQSIVASIITLPVLKREWEYLLKRVKKLLMIEESLKLQVELSQSVEESHPYFKKTKKLFKTYNRVRINTYHILKKNFNIKEKFLPSYINFPSKYENKREILYLVDLEDALEDMEMEIEKTITLIEELSFKVSIPESRKEELRGLEKVVDEKIYPELPDYAADLKESIRYFQEGFLLGAVLIAGRVITADLDRINSKIPLEERKNWDKLSGEEKNIRWWREARKILKIEQKEELTIKGVKLYRDIFSHKPGVLPSNDEAHLIIAAGVLLTRKIVELKIYEK